MDPFVAQLADLCTVHRTRAKWVFVPTHSIGHTLGERIALEGTNWLNLRFVTPLDIALRMGAPFLVERGIDPSEEGLGPALMMRLLLDLPLERGYFRPLADHPTLAQAMWTTVRELRMAGVRPSDLKAEAFSEPNKHTELVALLSAYEAFLNQNKRGDMATVYQEAVKHPDWCPIQPQDCWTELPETNWSPLQRRVIDAMPGERIRPRAFALSGVAVPRRLMSHGTDRVAPDPASNRLAFLMAPASAATPQTVPKTRIDLFHAGGREAEIEEVFRRILATGASLDQVEIACASDAHVALVWEKALRHEWPVTLGPGVPAAFTRPGRALVGLCDWVETDFSAGHFRRLLQSGDLAVKDSATGGDMATAGAKSVVAVGPSFSSGAGFSAGQAARLLARAEAGWGRATYGLALARLHKSYQSRAADAEASDEDRADAAAKADQTRQVREWITSLVESIPAPGANGASDGPGGLEGKVPLQSVVTGVLDFLHTTTARSSALDHRAAAVLEEYIGELRALGSFHCGLAESLRFIRERVQSLHVAPERPRPGHLYACTLAQSGYAGRRHLFIVGLEEGRVFSSSTEDAVLLDAERRGISADLRLSTDRVDEAVYSVLTRLAASPGSAGSAPALPAAGAVAAVGVVPAISNLPFLPALPAVPGPPALERLPAVPAMPGPPASSITLSYSCRDTREFRETYASWLMLQAFRLQQENAAPSYMAMKAALGEPKSAVATERVTALSTGAWWLRTIVGTGDEGIEALAPAFTGIASGRAADASRESAEFTAFDGYVPEAGPVLDPSAPETAYSVTELEKAAECPFRFFLKRGLGVRPIDERERDKDVWIDPLTRGSELHALYASLLRRTRDGNRGPTKEDGEWLLALAKTRLETLNDEMPAPTAEILDRESHDFMADVELFLEAESSNPSSTPIGLEVSFGRPLSDEDPNEAREPLARAEPVEVDLGKGLTFRIAGRIDRIDKVGASSFEVMDYKTGGFWRDKWKGSFDGGRRLQHALYGLAAAELLKTRYKNPTVTAGVYYFSSHKGRKERVRIPAPARAAIAAVLGDLRDVITRGEFVRTRDSGHCRFCDYAAVCGDEVTEQAGEKFEDSKLEARRRLAAHV